MRRAFYIISHNPDTKSEVEASLRLGANAIEPDVAYHDDGHFYVHEVYPVPVFSTIGLNTSLRLETYLGDLKTLLQQNSNLNLQLIALDLKNPAKYDINRLLDVIRASFSDFFPGILIVATCGSSGEKKFIAALNPFRPGERIGSDNGEDPAVVGSFFASHTAPGLKTIYAAGNSVFSPVGDDFFSGLGRLIVPSAFQPYFQNLQKAVAMRDAGNSFDLVYAWTINDGKQMRKYLDLGIDCMITDDKKIAQLLSILNEEKYRTMYFLAGTGSPAAPP
jgi:hypothetical protein